MSYFLSNLVFYFFKFYYLLLFLLCWVFVSACRLLLLSRLRCPEAWGIPTRDGTHVPHTAKQILNTRPSRKSPFNVLLRMFILKTIESYKSIKIYYEFRLLITTLQFNFIYFKVKAKCKLLGFLDIREFMNYGRIEQFLLLSLPLSLRLSVTFYTTSIPVFDFW